MIVIAAARATPRQSVVGSCAQVLGEVERDLLPSKLCEYLFELSGKFNQFYESCSVLNAETAELQRSRLALCEVTASVLRLGLDLLGIEALERL